MNVLESGRFPSAAEAVAANLLDKGAHLFEQAVDPLACAELLARVRHLRRFDQGLFLSEAEFDADPHYTGVNPKPGRNLLEQMGDLAFVERAPPLVEALSTLLGGDYQLLNRKFVCGIPDSSIPEWVRRRVLGNPVNNLGAYVRPEFRDITYFSGIDFHQDLIDYKDRVADFLTAYVYLHPVSDRDAPLHLLEGSHRLGASVFPHDLARIGPCTWRYDNGQAGQMSTTECVLIGEAGFAAIWHACTLHGTRPTAADRERISLRYLFARGNAASATLDAVNSSLRGRLSLASTREDLAADGSAAISGNVLLDA
jgi:hypothetical protein